MDRRSLSKVYHTHTAKWECLFIAMAIVGCVVLDPTLTLKKKL